MPEAPIGGGNGGFQNPWQPGQGQLGQGQLGQGVGPRLPGSGAGNYYPTPSSAPAGGSAFSPNGPSLNSAPVAGGYGTYAPTRANLATPAQTASKYIASNNGSDIARQYGLPPVSNIGADTGGKAFSNYQAPSGYSPWNNLTLPTNNGTTNPYTAYVKPAMDQQMFNSHISEQINGVQTQQRLYQGTPGYEVPISGAGLANPSQFINYSTH